MVHYLLCSDERSNELLQSQANSLLKAVADAAHDHGDKIVEGMARTQRLLLADFAKQPISATIEDRTLEWKAIDRLLQDSDKHYLLLFNKVYWFIMHEHWEQAKKELDRIANSNTTPPLECVRALSDAALIELFLDNRHRANFFLKNAKSVVNKSRKKRAVGTGRDAMGSYFGRYAVLHALKGQFERAEKLINNMHNCIGEDGIAPIYRVWVRGLEAKAGVKDISFGTFGDKILIAPPTQGVEAAIELLCFFETLSSKMRVIDRLAIRAALKMLQSKTIRPIS
jgi:hypothetical protein